MTLADTLKAAVETAVAQEVHEAVAKELRAALREHEEVFSAIIRNAVRQAITEMLSGEGKE